MSRLGIWLIVALVLAACLRPASTPPTSPPASSTTLTIPLDSPAVPPAGSAAPAGSEAPAGDVDPNPTPSLEPTPTPVPTNPPSQAPEYPVSLFPLAGPINTSQAEISAMDWHQDTLILVPQYPSRFSDSDQGALFALDKTEILAFLSGESLAPLEPRRVPLVAPGLVERIPGFEGFEAIAFENDRVYMTIEARQGQMVGYLVTGYADPDLGWISLDATSLTPIQPQTTIPNLSDEALVIFGNRLVTLYEANGVAVNPAPVAHLFDASSQPRDQLSFPNIEFRLTDATRVDDSGRFWAINTFYTGDTSLSAGLDPLALEFGEGATHSQTEVVERLVEFQFSEQGIVLADTPPVQLQLSDLNQTRNWEAIARLDEAGFLLATDEFPETLFAFVPYPP